MVMEFRIAVQKYFTSIGKRNLIILLIITGSHSNILTEGIIIAKINSRCTKA